MSTAVTMCTTLKTETAVSMCHLAGRRKYAVSYAQPIFSTGAAPGDEDRCLGATFELQFRQNATDVVLYGLLGEVERLCDLTVGLPPGDQVEHLLLLVRQLLDLLAPPHHLAEVQEQTGGRAGVEERTSRCTLLDGTDYLAAPGLFEQVAGGPGHDGGDQRFVVRIRGEDDNATGRLRGADGPAGLDPVAVRQSHVQEHQVGRESRRLRHRLAHRAGLAHHADLRVLFQQGA